MKRIAAVLPLLLMGAGCDGSLLDEQVYSELGPTNFFRNEQDAFSLLNSIYDLDQNYAFTHDFIPQEVTTDLLIIRQGGLRGIAQPLEDFTWDATHQYFNTVWDREYRIAYRSNLALESFPGIAFNEGRKQQMLAEVRFLRAVSYMRLDDYFGPVPLITDPAVDPTAQPARATEEEMNAFLESELRAAATALAPTPPLPYRATKGAALAMLARHYLNNKKWQQAADVAKEVMDLGTHSLFAAPRRIDLYRIENERNPEMIWVAPFVTNLKGSDWMARVAPPNYRFQAPPKTNYATQYMMPTAFYNSFHPSDQRREGLITEYTNTQGRVVKLGTNNVRAFKYPEDMNATGVGSGNDFPVMRYADVLLIRAEALNELRGPNQESIDLINQVRAQAAAPAVTLAQLPSRDALRDHILKERGWEFYAEGLRRSDLIRHGRFVQMAQQRGKAAQPHHVLFPIPQSEVDKNPKLMQNAGY